MSKPTLYRNMGCRHMPICDSCVPVEPCESFSPESERHCHNPKGHDGAHEAYMSYGCGVFHTVSWAHTTDERAGIGDTPMSEPTLYQTHDNDLMLSGSLRDRFKMAANLLWARGLPPPTADEIADAMVGVLVPVKPDYEAASEVLRDQRDNYGPLWITLVTPIVDAALGIGGDDG